MRTVGIAKTDYTHVYDGVAEAVEKAGGISNTPDRICIKVNLCDCRTPETGAVTDPRFLEALLSYIQSSLKPDRIFVAESNATSARPDLIMKWLGYEKILHRFKATWINGSRALTRPVAIMGRHFKQLDVPEVVLDSYLISLAKLKTHMLTTISCGLKNIYGLLPYPRKVAFHPFLDDAIVDANLAMHPRFSIVDGIIAQVGTQGPAYGVPIRANVVVAGSDIVSVDAACCKLLGFSPFFVGHLRKAHCSGLGSIRPEIVGHALEGLTINPEYRRVEKIAFSVARMIRDARSQSRASQM